MNSSRFWVVGGEYTSCDCEKIVQGTERVIGPFESRTEAERTWRSLSEDHRHKAGDDGRTGFPAWPIAAATRFEGRRLLRRDLPCSHEVFILRPQSS